MPTRYFSIWSASYKAMVVNFKSPRPSFLHIDRGIRLMFSPRSQKALSILCCPLMQGIEKLSRSWHLGVTCVGSLRCIPTSKPLFGSLLSTFGAAVYLSWIWKISTFVPMCLGRECLGQASLITQWIGRTAHQVFPLPTAEEKESMVCISSQELWARAPRWPSCAF